MNSIERERIIIVKGDKTTNGAKDRESGKRAVGYYQIHANTIAICREQLRMDGGSKLSLRCTLLKTLIHEMCHAISATKFTGTRKVDEVRKKGSFFSYGNAEIASGYSILRIKYAAINRRPFGTIQESFVLFDEGVTELMAREILSQYLAADENFATKEEIDAYRGNPYPMYYETQILIIGIIKRIAEYLGFDEHIVWRALFRSKIEGIDLTDRENQLLFRDVIPRKLFKDLETANEKRMADLMVDELGN